MIQPAARAAPFHGWRVVGGVFVVMMGTSGLAFYNASILLTAFVREIGLEVGAVSLATGGFFLVSGVAGVGVGWAIEKFSARLVMVAGGVLGSITLLCLPLVSSSLGVWAFFLALGFTYTLSGLIPSTTLITRWFTRQRPMAMAVAYNGLSLGGILITPIAGWMLFAHSIQAASWVMAGLYALFTIVPSLLLVKDSPEQLGQRPDGALVDPNIAAAPAQGATLRQAMQTRFYRMLVIAWMACMLAQIGAIAHLYNLAAERAGLSWAPFVVMTLAAASVTGRLLGGLALARIDAIRFAFIALALQGVGQLALAMALTPTTILVAAAMFGLSMGNVLMMLPLLLARSFGAAHYGRIYGVSQLFMTIGGGTGPALMGLLHDASDGYMLPYWLAAGATAVGAGALALAGRAPLPR